jgi:putative intracellular protease/amidase
LRKIKLLGLGLRANSEARRAYASLRASPSFGGPVPYSTLHVDQYDGLVLPGGHWARGMRQYLEDQQLQRFVGDFFDADKPVAAICHGVVLAARSVSKRTGHSVLSLGYRSVQAEVSRALASPADFCDVPKEAGDYFRKTSGLFRDSVEDERPAWVVRDRRYVSARWPGDVHAFAVAFAAVLAEFRAAAVGPTALA